MKHIFIDTNVLFNDILFDGPNIRRILRYKKIVGIKLLISQIVIDELLGNYRIELYSAGRKINQAFKEIEKKVVPIQKNKFKPIDAYIERNINLYADKLQTFIKENEIEIISYPKISHRKIIEKIYKREIPFHDSEVKEKGYKDYLISKTLVAYKKKIPDASVILLTNNFYDFTGKKHKDKAENMSSLIAGKYVITICTPKDIQELIFNKEKMQADEIIKDIDQYFSKLVNHILNDDVLKSELYDSIIFNPSVKSNKWIVETIEVSKYGDMVSIEGRFNLSLILDFNLNSVEFEIDDLHLFKDRILNLINNQTQTYWEYKFYDFSLNLVVSFSHDIDEMNDIFNFNYLLIDVERNLTPAST